MSGLGAAAALASLLAGAGSPRIAVPTPTELAERSVAIVEQVAAASRREGQDVDSAVARLGAVMTDVSRRFGENSVESVQAATEAGIALIRDWQRFDLAHPHIARSLALSRAVFGTDHRETAYALQDLAVVRQQLRPELFVQWSGPLAREAIAVRTRVLGPDHLETAGSERYLATWLFESWRTQRRASADSPVLVEARNLANHALDVLEVAYGVTHFEVVGLRYLRAQIALAMQDYVLAETLADELLYRYEAPCHTDSGEPGAREMLADALRGQGRIADSEAAADAAAADGCNAPALTP
jgi:hypothetical protein